MQFNTPALHYDMPAMSSCIARLHYDSAGMRYGMAALQYRKPGLQYDMRALNCDKPALSYCMPRLRYDNAGKQSNRCALQYDKRADLYVNPAAQHAFPEPEEIFKQPSGCVRTDLIAVPAVHDRHAGGDCRFSTRSGQS
jgi:hypothetical protein